MLVKEKFLNEQNIELKIFLYLCTQILDFAINSARNSSPDSFPNQRGL